MGREGKPPPPPPKKKLLGNSDFLDSKRNLGKASFQRCFQAFFLNSRPQRMRSFWSATSGQVQRHSGFEWSCKYNRLRQEPIRFIRLDSEHAQSDRKSMNRGLPLLDLPRGRDSWCWPKECGLWEREWIDRYFLFLPEVGIIKAVKFTRDCGCLACDKLLVNSKGDQKSI